MKPGAPGERHPQSLSHLPNYAYEALTGARVPASPVISSQVRSVKDRLQVAGATQALETEK